MNLKNVYKRIAIKRVSFSVLITIIYIVGSTIELPGVNASHLMDLLNKSPNLAIAASVTGMSLNRFSLFSIGIGPWMSALILWRVLTVTKLFNIQNLTTRQSYFYKFVISLVVGVIQGLGILYNMELTNHSLYNYFMLIVIILAGLSILIWLGNLNIQRGVGGATVIIMASIAQTWLLKLGQYLSEQKLNTHFIIGAVIVVIATIIFTYLVVAFFNGQLRLPLMHVMLNNKYSAQSYLPIPVNPAGGMPYMYAFTIVSLPQYLLSALRGIIANNKIIDNLYVYLQLDNPIGISLVILIIILLTYGFAFVNIDNQEIATSLKKNGDYFPNVYPGQNTADYLSDKIIRMATVGALFNAVVIGIPMLISIYVTGISMVYQIVAMWLMWIILFQEILRQFFSLYNMGKYNNFIDD